MHMRPFCFWSPLFMCIYCNNSFSFVAIPVMYSDATMALVIQ
jgi:hypothetical protein